MSTFVWAYYDKRTFLNSRLFLSVFKFLGWHTKLWGLSFHLKLILCFSRKVIHRRDQKSERPYIDNMVWEFQKHQGSRLHSRASAPHWSRNVSTALLELRGSVATAGWPSLQTLSKAACREETAWCEAPHSHTWGSAVTTNGSTLPRHRSRVCLLTDLSLLLTIYR